MAVYSAATLLVPMGLLKIVLLVVMSSSCSIAAELSSQEFDADPVHINAYGRRDHARSADHQCHVSSSLSMDDAAKHASTHRRQYSKNDAPGVRFDMTRRAPSCAGLPMLQGAESRSRHFACALERSSRRKSLLAGKKTTTEYLRSVTQDTADVSGEASSDWTFPESATVGEFVVPIYLGTPPIKSNVIIDTGSDLTWIQSQPCSSCYKQVDPIFDPSKSSTYNKLPCSSPICEELFQNKQCSSSGFCRYLYQYGDRSETEGYFSTETMTVGLTTGGKSAVALFKFGASDISKGNFKDYPEEEGVLGLGQGPVSLPSQLGNEFGNKFSYCLVDWLSDETSSMYFGDAAVPKGEVQYTPIVPNAEYPTYYYIRVMGISVGPSRLPIEQSVFEIDSSGNGGTIIDSGTTISFFLPEAFDQIVAAYKSQVKYPVIMAPETGLELCFDTAGVRSPSFPTMEIHLDGAHLSLPTLNTFVTLEETITCLAFRPNNDTNFRIALVGNIQQQNFDIVYDLENMRIGFSPADCSSV